MSYSQYQTVKVSLFFVCLSNDTYLICHCIPLNFFPFSSSSYTANWHTDGASKDRVYDAVSLLCIQPSSKGGKSKVSQHVHMLCVLYQLPADLITPDPLFRYPMLATLMIN